jgi:hypothetical protein
MQFYIGQVFEKKYPPEAAQWCNENRAYIGKSGNDTYTIFAAPAPAPEQLQEAKRHEMEEILASVDWMSVREYDRKAENPDCEMDMSVFEYKKYVRDFDNQQGDWWLMEIKTYEEWIIGNSSSQ